MAENKSLDKVAGKAGFWYSIGNILIKGCVFLSLPIFTRILSTSDFGIYNTYMAYEGIFCAILGLGFYGTVKNAKLDFKEKFNEYISSIITFSLIILMFVVVLVNILYSSLFYKLGFSLFVTNCLVLQSYGAFLINFYGAKLNIEFKYKSFIVISSFNTIANIFLSIFLILYVFPHEKYLGRIIGSAMPMIILSIVIVFISIIKGKKFVSRKYWKYALLLGLPLIPHVVSQSLLSQFDRVMISSLTNNSESGIYSYMYTICTIMSVICSSLDNAWTPWVYINLQSDNKKHIKETSKKYILFFALLTLGFICSMPEVTKSIAAKDYWEGIDLLVPLSLANFCIFLYMLPVNIEYYNKKTAFISIGTILAALLNLLLNFVFIKLFDYKAAAYTTLFSYFCLFLFHWKIADKLNVKEYYDLKFIMNILIGLTTVSFSTTIFIGGTFNLLYRLFIIVLILIYMYKQSGILLRTLKK